MYCNTRIGLRMSVEFSRTEFYTLILQSSKMKNQYFLSWWAVNVVMLMILNFILYYIVTLSYNTHWNYFHNRFQRCFFFFLIVRRIFRFIFIKSLRRSDYCVHWHIYWLHLCFFIRFFFLNIFNTLMDSGSILLLQQWYVLWFLMEEQIVMAINTYLNLCC